MGRPSTTGTARADLHLHSTYSDGVHSPRHLIELAAAAGLSAVSITDHDAVDGIEEAQAAGQTLGVEVIPGVELSTNERGIELHVLGYFIDPKCEQLKEYLRFFQEERLKRVQKIVDLLKAVGCPVSFEGVMRYSPHGSVGRPHIAQAMVDCGFVSSPGEAFARYLSEDRPAFVPKYKILASEAIALINAAGGPAFVAHPGNNVPDDLILALIKQGLQGIETVHPRHSASDTYRYRSLAARYGVLETGGSDFHGFPHEAALGTYVVSYSAVRRMRQLVPASQGNGESPVTQRSEGESRID